MDWAELLDRRPGSDPTSGASRKSGRAAAGAGPAASGNPVGAEINGHIEDDAYPVACALSELKNKFLLAPLAEHLREERAATQQEALPPSQPRRKPEASDGGPRENDAENGGAPRAQAVLLL